MGESGTVGAVGVLEGRRTDARPAEEIAPGRWVIPMVADTAPPTPFTFRHASASEFWEHLARDVPINHAMWRANEATALAGLEVPRPILDVGCGDGYFASVVFTEPADVGIDLWEERLVKAIARGAYCEVRRANAMRLPFDDGSFGTVFSNCVLEHIPDVDRVCAEVSRVLRPGGCFVFTVPTENFGRLLFHTRWMRRIGLGLPADLYLGLLNRVFVHHHCESPDRWRERLATAGLEMTRCDVIMAPELEALWDLLMPVAMVQRTLKRYIPGATLPIQWLVAKLNRAGIAAKIQAHNLTLGGNMLIVAYKPVD